MTCYAGIVIVKTTKKTSERFPSGQFIYEPLYAIFKQSLTLAIIIFAVVGAVSKIIVYHTTGVGETFKTGPIIIYSLLWLLHALA